MNWNRLLVWLWVVCALQAGLVQAELEVRVCYEDHEQPPYTLGADFVPEMNAGIWVDLADQAIRGAGLKPVFYRQSWKRCIADLKSGRADTTFAMIWTEERDAWAQFPKGADGAVRTEAHLWNEVYLIFVPRDGELRWDGEHFQGVTFGIGAPIAYIAFQRLEALDALSPLIVDVTAGLKLTARGRMDGYTVDQATGQLLIKQLQLETALTRLPIPFMQSFSYLPVSHRFYRAHPGAAERIWRKLASIREQQRAALLKQYNAQP